MRRNHRRTIKEILLIEDTPGDVRLTIEALKESSIKAKMSVISDGEEAIKYLKQDGKYSKRPKPDLILLDLWLPKKTGHEILEYIKSDKSLKDIFVAILTSSTDEDDIRKAYKFKTSGYITKKADYIQLSKDLAGFYSFSSLKRKKERA
jgi:two-component system, chemotaxis family, response regulator Rcp1